MRVTKEQTENLEEEKEEENNYELIIIYDNKLINLNDFYMKVVFNV